MRILVGITGGVAAYKAAEIIREFTESGHDVRAVPTANALKFIGSATLEALTHNSVHSELYEDVADVRHIELAKWAQLVVIAPATASFLARTSSGIADDLLGNIVLATSAPIVIAPAMHTEMWNNPATVQNVETLRERGFTVIEPAVGRLTGKDEGIGRLPEPGYIASAALARVRVQDLLGKQVLIVAGGTREPIDPVRFIGNRSSGKQGIALVEEAVSRGAKVSLIAANFEYYSPEVKTRLVSSSADLQLALGELATNFDFIVMPAAVSDYRPADPSHHKLKKQAHGEAMELSLIQNPDIIADLAGKLQEQKSSTKIVGFAAETENGSKLLKSAQAKMERKNLDLLVANEVSDTKGFDQDANEVILISKMAHSRFSGTKREIAQAIFDFLVAGK